MKVCRTTLDSNNVITKCRNRNRTVNNDNCPLSRKVLRSREPISKKYAEKQSNPLSGDQGTRKFCAEKERRPFPLIFFCLHPPSLYNTPFFLFTSCYFLYTVHHRKLLHRRPCVLEKEKRDDA